MVLKDGETLRQVDRRFYLAYAYEYPVALFHEPRRLLLAHCPKSYLCNRAGGGGDGAAAPATAEREPCDFFHSRLAASPHGNRLLSAGWAWHPMDIVNVSTVPSQIRADRVSPYSGWVCLGEEASARSGHIR